MAKSFTSLRGLSLLNVYNSSRLLSALVASDQLETLQLERCEAIDIPRDQMALIFGRIRNLKLTASIVNPFVCAVLSSSVKLEKLRFKITDPFSVIKLGDEKTVRLLPELQFLSIQPSTVLQYLHAPKIASLDVRWGSPGVGSFDCHISNEFDFLSIRYLYPWTRPFSSYYILGSKEPNHCVSLFSDSTISKLDFVVEDGVREYSRDCFRLSFEGEDTFVMALSLVLSRVKNLIELHLLQPTVHFFHPPANNIVVTFPELQLLSIEDPSPLLEYLRAPKLSTLNVKWNTGIPTCQIWDEFNFSSIRHLYIRCFEDLEDLHEHGNYCILGSRIPVNDCEPFHLVIKDVPSERHGEYPRNCFHFTFQSETAFARALRELKIASFVLPQLTNLILLSPSTINNFRVIIPLTPVVEKVIVRHGSKLIDFIRLLNDASVFPRLKHLYFATFLIPRDIEQYAEDVGESLTTCLKYRRKHSAHVDLELKHIILRNCPPLPAIWLDELKKLGVAEIITETEVKNVIRKGAKVHKQGQFSDIHLNITNLD